MPINVLHNNIDEGTWVTVNFGNIKPKIYFGKVVAVIEKGKLFEGSFTRPSINKKNLDNYVHTFPDVVDFSEFTITQVIRILTNPKSLRDRWAFDVSVKSIEKEMMK